MNGKSSLDFKNCRSSAERKFTYKAAALRDPPRRKEHKLPTITEARDTGFVPSQAEKVFDAVFNRHGDEQGIVDIQPGGPVKPRLEREIARLRFKMCSIKALNPLTG